MDVYHSNGRHSREGIFSCLSIIISNVNQELFYKTSDYVPINGGLPYDHFFNYPPDNNLNDEQIAKLLEIKNKYNKPFKLVTANNNIEISCEQNLKASTSLTRMRIFVTDYCNIIKCLIELANVVENDF